VLPNYLTQISTNVRISSRVKYLTYAASLCAQANKLEAATSCNLGAGQAASCAWGELQAGSSGELEAGT